MTNQNGSNRPLTLDAYQRLALKTAVYPGRGSNLEYPILGLIEEVGEIAGQLKRVQRDDGGALTETRRQKMLAECGDALWYLAALSFELRLPLRQLAGSQNFQPLTKAAEKFAGMPLFSLLWRLEYYLGQAIGLLGQSQGGDVNAPIQPLVIVWAAVCVELGSTPEEVATMNIEKLAGRAERNALHGEGSER